MERPDTSVQTEYTGRRVNASEVSGYNSWEPRELVFSLGLTSGSSLFLKYFNIEYVRIELTIHSPCHADDAIREVLVCWVRGKT